MKYFSVILAGVVLAFSASATAQQPNSQKEEVGKQDRVICRNQEVIGSRLSKTRVCRTAAEWAELKRTERLAIDRVQSNRYKNE
jgi:invasion protein IalB